MNLIAAVDKNWSIGYNGDLLYHIKEDMKFFRAKTNGKVVVMGRKTLESLPGGNPLKNRINIVLSSNKDFNAPGCVVCHSFSELFEKVKAYDTNDVYVIGGESLYNMLMPYCAYAYITEIDAEKEADKAINNISKNASWQMVERSSTQNENGIDFVFKKYKNTLVRKM
ncbi:MAG: dihydrofolate reductase [Ruminococcaceae bacterium]|nr:dihydrofolate reductase [Oscillospiraceae bacterium]